MHLRLSTTLIVTLDGDEAEHFRTLMEKLHVTPAGFKRIELTKEERSLVQELHETMTPNTDTI